jgi:peptide/nickel transport system permease protein
VTTVLADRMWPTFQLCFAAMMLAILIGVPLGFVAR